MSAARSDPIDVLFIGGAGRCGSTLLDRILGQSAGVFAAGELNHLWTHALAQRGRCGCGELLADCPTWCSILDEAYGSDRAVLEQSMRHDLLRIRTRYLALARWGPGHRWPRPWLGPLPEQLGRLYAAIGAVTGAAVVVDASKDPAYARVLEQVPGIRLSMIHLVRGPRATAYSWQRRKTSLGHDDRRDMHQSGVVTSTLLWRILNDDCHQFRTRHPDRYLRVRYEDFAAAPAPTLARIAGFAGHDFGREALLTDRRVALGPTHSAWGNANRFEGQEVTINPDEQWSAQMSDRDKRVVEMLTVGARSRYGYR